MVQVRGLEPPRVLPHTVLSRTRIPIPPHLQKSLMIIPKTQLTNKFTEFFLLVRLKIRGPKAQENHLNPLA